MDIIIQWNKFRDTIDRVRGYLKNRGLIPAPRSRLHVRLMGKAESRREGFAYYTYGGTLMINRVVLSRLTTSDWIILALHEIGGHHHQLSRQSMQQQERCGTACVAAEERCAMRCELIFASHFGVTKVLQQWLKYRRARVRLDTAVRHGRVRTVSEAIRLFKNSGVPNRLVRARVELRRVRDNPGQVRGYLYGGVNRSPHCMCVSQITKKN